jgi:CheY-like chemotaxis protein
MIGYALIVDSDTVSAATYAALIRAERLSPVYVRDGAIAVTQILERGAPALLVVEAEAPHIDGLELIERLRRTPGGERTPVVVVSADRDLRDRAERLRGRLGIGAVLARAATGTSTKRVIQKLLGETDAHAPATNVPPAQVPEEDDAVESPGRSSWVTAMQRHLYGASTRRRST